jgi:hypothetical protein
MHSDPVPPLSLREKVERSGKKGKALNASVCIKLYFEPLYSKLYIKLYFEPLYSKLYITKGFKYIHSIEAITITIHIYV